MEWRFLVGKDTDTDAAVALTDRGHDAVTVEATIGKARRMRGLLDALGKRIVCSSPPTVISSMRN